MKQRIEYVIEFVKDLWWLIASIAIGLVVTIGVGIINFTTVIDEGKSLLGAILAGIVVLVITFVAVTVVAIFVLGVFAELCEFAVEFVKKVFHKNGSH